jgi:hypothetical protein
MYHTEQRRQLRIKIETKDCELPPDELPRIEPPLAKLSDIVGDLPGDLDLTIVHHPNRDQFHVKAALGLPRRTLFTGEWDSYLDTALGRSLSKLSNMAKTYQQEPEHTADEVARNVEQMNREIIAPEDPDMGPLGTAAAAGDYHNFRQLLGDYEDWLRLRVGRWLERYPDAEAEVGRRVKIGDLVEEVLLNAFERYGQRSNDVTLSDWLDSLINPSLQAYCQHPIEERENISLARTLRDTPLSPRGPRKPAKKKSPVAKKKKAVPAEKKKAAPAAKKKKKSKAPKAKPAAAKKKSTKASKAKKTAKKKTAKGAKKKTARR